MEPLNKDTSGPGILSFVERLYSFRGVLSAYPLLGGLSSFGVSFIGGFTVFRIRKCSNTPEINCMTVIRRELPADDLKLSTFHQSPLYDQIHDYEVVTSPRTSPAAITQQPLPPQPSGDCQLATCPAYNIPNAATAQGSKGVGEYDVPHNVGVSSVSKRVEGQYENVTKIDGVAAGPVLKEVVKVQTVLMIDQEVINACPCHYSHSV